MQKSKKTTVRYHNTFLKYWNHFSNLPFGKRIFSHLIGFYVPYTGSMGAVVKNISPGKSEIQLKERRKVRNHLQSVHAIALANLAEFAGNLALVSAMPDDARFIVKSFSIDYIKKARGIITAECSCPTLESNEKSEQHLQIHLKNRDGEIVTTATMVSMVGPKKTSPEVAGSGQ
ncbi:MAG: DUF4442 domain-containing protein [Calditrichaceae bacterium]